jgi:hypothetical protein
MESVSVRTVKSQGLGMNLSRLTGMCGRLKCCLNFVSEEDSPESLNCPHRKNNNGPGVCPHEASDADYSDNEENAELSRLS